MPNPLPALLSKMPRPARLAARFAVGLAQDFWKDGDTHPFARHLEARAAKKQSTVQAAATPSSSAAEEQAAAAPTVWHALPGEISEKMWGEGFVTPADAEVTEMLINPLGLNKDLSVLDLSAGLGGRLRRATEEFKVYITGLEPDPQIAARGMELSVRAGKGKHAEIVHYDPTNITLTRRYDCILARETFYRVPDRQAFFAVLAAATKPGAQVSFTDYIVNPEYRDNPAIKAWIAGEKGTNPASVVEMAEDWAKVGFKLRVHDDQTDMYIKHVHAGLKRLAMFMATGVTPDEETRLSLARRLRSWGMRIAALQNGAKFYRFYGTKM